MYHVRLLRLHALLLISRLLSRPQVVLLQELERWNKLVVKMDDSLGELQKALAGVVGMSNELDDLSVSLYNGRYALAHSAPPRPLHGLAVCACANLCFVHAPHLFLVSVLCSVPQSAHVLALAGARDGEDAGQLDAALPAQVRPVLQVDRGRRGPQGHVAIGPAHPRGVPHRAGADDVQEEGLAARQVHALHACHAHDFGTARAQRPHTQRSTTVPHTRIRSKCAPNVLFACLCASRILSSLHVRVRAQEKDVKEKPRDGCYITGLYLEGASWDFKNSYLRRQVRTPLSRSANAIRVCLCWWMYVGV